MHVAAFHGHIEKRLHGQACIRHGDRLEAICTRYVNQSVNQPINQLAFSVFRTCQGVNRQQLGK